jgi:hypothetical protein
MSMDLVKEIAERLKRNNVLLVAPTGWGKTLLMFRLAIQLAREGWKVGILAPTLTLLVKKWPFLTQLLSESPLRAILTAGAGQYCVYRWSVPQRHCRRCRLNRSVKLQLTQTAVTFEDIEKATPEDACGYWAQEETMINYDVILGHYGRLVKINFVHFLLIDEIHEYYLPHIMSYPLDEVAELLGVPAEELKDIAVIKELVAEKLSGHIDPMTEDRLLSLSSALRKVCWIEEENNTLHCLDLYDLPRNVNVFGATATPPPGWPPEGWGEKIEITPHIKPRAYVEPEASFYYNKRYEGATLQLYLITRWLQKFNVQRIAIFATSSLRSVLQHSLPPGVELFPAGG